jgi:hypothetical protein
MNWHCHCSDVARDGDRVHIRPSGRVPGIVHLSDLKNAATAARYRELRLFYERCDQRSVLTRLRGLLRANPTGGP